MTRKLKVLKLQMLSPFHAFTLFNLFLVPVGNYGSIYKSKLSYVGPLLSFHQYVLTFLPIISYLILNRGLGFTVEPATLNKSKIKIKGRSGHCSIIRW